MLQTPCSYSLGVDLAAFVFVSLTLGLFYWLLSPPGTLPRRPNLQARGPFLVVVSGFCEVHVYVPFEENLLN